MADDIAFRRDLEFEYGRLETIAPGLRRIVARNPGPFTWTGTGTYVVGTGKVAVIDPGPDIAEHVEALLGALRGETVTHIVVTHTHRDHSPAAAAVKAATGAPTWGFGPHGGIAPGAAHAHDVVEEGGDRDFAPDVTIGDGDVVEGDGWRLEAVHTPGHTSNHLCFAWPETGILFSGDHVMGWSTSVIAPPDGDMAAYLASLEKLTRRGEQIYWPTHGPHIAEPVPFVRSFIRHREAREAAILARLASGDRSIPDLVRAIYVGLDPRLFGAAGRSVAAHLVKLAAEGRIRAERDAAGGEVWLLQ